MPFSTFDFHVSIVLTDVVPAISDDCNYQAALPQVEALCFSYLPVHI